MDSARTGSERQILAVVGAGGHGKVVLDSINSTRVEGAPYPEVVFVDPGKAGQTQAGARVLESVDGLPSGSFIIAIGNNRIRKRCYEEFLALGWTPVAVIDKSAIISPSARVGRGTLVGAGAIINSHAVVGENTIVNTGAIIEHDCLVGDSVHIAPRSVLGGAVTVGEGSLLGIGSTVLPLARVGCWSTLGAGSTLLKELPDNATCVGCPAKPMDSGG